MTFMISLVVCDLSDLLSEMKAVVGPFTTANMACRRAKCPSQLKPKRVNTFLLNSVTSLSLDDSKKVSG